MAQFNPDVLPPEYRRSYDELSDSAKSAWRKQRLRGQIDHLFLGCDLMGYDFQANPHNKLFAEFLHKDPEQKKQLYELDEQFKKRMILWPRGLFKTSATIVEMVQLILNFPDIRILILSGSQTLAKRQLARCKKVFEKPSSKFRQLYPEFCALDDGKKAVKLGNAEEFTVPCRKLDQLAEPTVCISTGKSVKAGSHFDVIFVDDIVNDQNYRSLKMLESCWEQYKDIGPLLQPSGYMYVTGTVYAFGDTYEKIEESADAEMQKLGKTVWKKSIRSCWVIPCKTCGHHDSDHNKDRNYSSPPCTVAGCGCQCFIDSGKKDVLFPRFVTRDGRQEGHTVGYLESEREEKGESFFACQYENRRLAQSEQRFTPALLSAQTFWHLNEIPIDAGTFMVGDLSYVGSDKQDESVLYLCKIAAGSIWMYHCISGKWDSDEATSYIIAAILQHRPQAVWLERFLGWDAYNQLLMGKANAAGLQQLPVAWIKMNTEAEAKKIRIGGIVSWLKQRKLWLFGGMHKYDLLCKQLSIWPKLGKYDDFADCCGLVCEAPHGAAIAPPPRAESPIDIVRQLHADRRARMEAEQFNSGGTGTGLVCG